MSIIASDQDFNLTARIYNLPAPIDPAEPARYADVLAIANGLPKLEARLASDINVDITAPGTVLDGLTMVLNDRVLLFRQTLPEQNGIWSWNGPATPMTRTLDADAVIELERALVAVRFGTYAGVGFRQLSLGFVLDVDPIEWVLAGNTSPPASTTLPGILEIATQAEVNAGTATNLAVTPETLAGSEYVRPKYVANIGAGSNVVTVTHNLNSRDVTVVIYRNSTPWDTIENVTVERTSVNVVTLRFSATVTTAQYRVIVAL